MISNAAADSDSAALIGGAAAHSVAMSLLVASDNCRRHLKSTRQREEG